MITHTYPIYDGSNLRTLVRQVQSTHQPIALTSEGAEQPVAIVLKVDAFEQTQRYRQHFFLLQLMFLDNWLDKAEQYWTNKSIRKECVNNWKDNIKLLWEISPEHLRKYAASFSLSVQRLSPENLTLDQIEALRNGLTLFHYPELDTVTKRDAYQKLTQSGLPPRFVFDNEIIQSYFDEL